jgi:hypothetical protein
MQAELDRRHPTNQQEEPLRIKSKKKHINSKIRRALKVKK